MSLKASVHSLRRELRLNKIAMISNAIPSFSDIDALFPDLCFVTYVAQSRSAKSEILFRLQHSRSGKKVSYNVLVEDFVRVLCCRCYSIVDISGDADLTSEELLSSIIQNSAEINCNRPFLIKLSSNLSLSSAIGLNCEIISQCVDFLLVRINP